jgi:hypothetical protein
MITQIGSGTSPDGYKYTITREKNFKFTILTRFWVHYQSKKDKAVRIFSVPFNKPEHAKEFAKTFRYTEDVKPHL